MSFATSTRARVSHLLKSLFSDRSNKARAIQALRSNKPLIDRWRAYNGITNK